MIYVSYYTTLSVFGAIYIGGVKVTGKRYQGQTLEDIGCGLIEELSSHLSRNTEKTKKILIQDRRCS